MTDKEKIKDWISKEQDGLMDAQGNFGYPEHEGAYDILCDLDAFIDSLQEEPVSKPIDFEKELYKAFGQVKDFTLGMRIAKWFYNMGKNSQEPVSEDLEEAAIEICSKVLEGETIIIDGYEYVVLSDAEECFKAGAKWKEEQMVSKDNSKY